MQLTQEDVEKALADVLPHGSRETIAKGTGIYPAIVSAFFNPYDERKSPHFTVLHIQAVLDRECPDIGDALWLKMSALREASKPKRVSPDDVNVSVAEKVTNDARTTSLMIEAAKDGKIDHGEAMQIRQSIAAERDNLDRLESFLPTEAVN